jgi:hypothetical protein
VGLSASGEEGFTVAIAKRFPMKDESLIEEMRAAIRNDQDRAQARRQTAPRDSAGGSVEVGPTKSEAILQTEAIPQTFRSHLGRLFGRGRSAI